MLEIITKIIFALLAIIGLTEIIRFIMFRILIKSNVGKLYLIVSIKGHDESAEMKLQSAIERLRWSPGKYKKLICLDKGMDEETAMVCRIISHQNPGVQFCTPDEFSEMLNQ